VATQITADAEGGIQAGDWILAVSPVRMDDGRLLMWHPPQPVAFNLVEARKFRDRGVRARRSIMSKLKLRPPGASHHEEQYGPQNSHTAVDCVSDLQAAVLFAFTAVESLANHAIEMLDQGATVTVRKGKEVTQPEMTRGVGIDAKLKLIVPLVSGSDSIAGTSAWERYLALKSLRDELLHVKRRGYEPEPETLTAYDRLMLGEADGCVEDAAMTVEGAWPGFLPQHVRATLGLFSSD
jgi:hypothetical protein